MNFKNHKALTLFILIAFLITACSKKLTGGAKSGLLPIFNSSLFITNNGKKWGVTTIDGKKVIPFICDGVRQLSDTLGIASIYSGSYSLNTGIPRYVYCGNYFLFTKNGRVSGSDRPFSITVQGVADNHNGEFILSSHVRYLPSDTLSQKPCNPSGFLRLGQ